MTTWVRIDQTGHIGWIMDRVDGLHDGYLVAWSSGRAWLTEDEFGYLDEPPADAERIRGQHFDAEQGHYDALDYLRDQEDYR